LAQAVEFQNSSPTQPKSTCLSIRLTVSEGMMKAITYACLVPFLAMADMEACSGDTCNGADNTELLQRIVLTDVAADREIKEHAKQDTTTITTAATVAFQNCFVGKTVLIDKGDGYRLRYSEATGESLEFEETDDLDAQWIVVSDGNGRIKFRWAFDEDTYLMFTTDYGECYGDGVCGRDGIDFENVVGWNIRDAGDGKVTIISPAGEDQDDPKVLTYDESEAPALEFPDLLLKGITASKTKWTLLNADDASTIDCQVAYTAPSSSPPASIDSSCASPGKTCKDYGCKWCNAYEPTLEACSGTNTAECSCWTTMQNKANKCSEQGFCSDCKCDYYKAQRNWLWNEMKDYLDQHSLIELMEEDSPKILACIEKEMKASDSCKQCSLLQGNATTNPSDATSTASISQRAVSKTVSLEQEIAHEQIEHNALDASLRGKACS